MLPRSSAPGKPKLRYTVSQLLGFIRAGVAGNGAHGKFTHWVVQNGADKTAALGTRGP